MVGATSNYSGISEEPAATTDLPTLNRLTASIQLPWVTTAFSVRGNSRLYGETGTQLVLQPIMPLDLPVKVRSWELTVYPRSHI